MKECFHGVQMRFEASSDVMVASSDLRVMRLLRSKLGSHSAEHLSFVLNSK